MLRAFQLPSYRHCASFVRMFQEPHDGIRELTRTVGIDQSPGCAVHYEVWEATDIGCDGRNSGEKRLDGASEVLRVGWMDRNVQIRIDGTYIFSGAREYRAVSEPFGREGHDPTLIPVGTLPRSPDEYELEDVSPVLEDGCGSDENPHGP